MKSGSDTSVYEKFETTDETEDSIGDKQLLKSWRILFRQVLVCSTIWTLYFIYGLQLGAPTVIVPQLKKETNFTTKIDDDLTSWIMSMITFGAMPWVLILPPLLQLVGRKLTVSLVCVSACIGTLVIYLSETIKQLLIGEFIFGIVLASHHTISPFIIAEYTSPKYRGLFLTIKSASLFWGTWMANAIGTYLHWKNIYILHFICNVYTLTITAWPESSYWLAKKKRFNECKRSHRWMKGTSRNAEEELVHIINYYEPNQQTNNLEINKVKLIKEILNTLTNRAWFKPFSLMVCAGLQYMLTGKIVCNIYAVQLLKKITGNESTAYKGMLILDGVTVLATYCGCVMSKYFKRRTMLFSTSFITIIFLYSITLYLYLVHISVISEKDYLVISLFSAFSITVCSGPMILLSTMFCEVIPIRYQRSSTMAYGCFMNSVMAVLLKISPLLFAVLTLPGTFFFFAISSTILTLILYLYLPETKDKTLKEIEEYFTRNTKLNKQSTFRNESSLLQFES